MDTWNPWIAETHVKRVRWWEIATVMVIGIVTVIAFTWAFAIILFQIDQFFPWLAR